MAEILKRTKAMSVNPLKSSSTVGATLAFLGIDGAIPMLHGSQGCSAFGKVFLVRHFREPIPMQTTAIDQSSAVMGADANVVEGLATLCSNARPALIGIPTTGLTETEGSDIQRVVREFRARHPEHAGTAVVAVATPDFTGCLESGFATATRAVIEALVPESGNRPGRRPGRINVLAGADLTPGDIEELKDLIAAFGLDPLVVPDLSDSLDGHLSADDFSPVTTGGAKVADIRTMGESAATLVFGSAMSGAADVLAKRTGVPDYRFEHAMGLQAVDAMVATLAGVSGRPVPVRVERQRARLQDAMMDTHFMLGTTAVGVAGDPDMLNAFAHLLASVGAEVAVAVASDYAPVLRPLPARTVKIGDIEDLAVLFGDKPPAILIGNSHLARTAEELGVPLLRAGIPQYDVVGSQQRAWIGYRGSCRTLFEFANLAFSGHHGPVPYRSIFSSPDHLQERHGQTLEARGSAH